MQNPIQALYEDDCLIVFDKPAGLLVIQSVPFADAGWKYSDYGAATDYLVLMAYDQHYTTGDPGPVAAQDWFEQTLLARMRDLNPSKTIIALGNYGYDWSDRQQDAKELTFQEALITARESEAKPAFDSSSRNLWFEYDEDDGSHHTVWFLDAVTTFNQMRAASGFKPAGFAIWRLGSEDPSIWSLLGRPTDRATICGASTMDTLWISKVTVNC